MSETIINDENKMKDGKMNLMGVNIDIGSILGDKIVDQYIAQIKDEDMEKVLSYISSDLFEESSVYNYEIKERVTKLKVRVTEKDRWGNNTKEISIGDLIKNRFNSRIQEELKNKVEEIIASADYQKKIDEIANELVEYSINGYKEDMKARIRERLVGNVLGSEPIYCGDSLKQIIYNCINEIMHR